MKKEFKMIRDSDKRKQSHDENEACTACNGEKKDYTLEQYNALSCKHCNYDYTKKEGMLVDEKRPDSVYIRHQKKWLVEPCDKCNKEYADKIIKLIEWAYEDEYEYELSMQKIDAYLDRY
jgi:major membrane immunogen (membrane-anchored lipoprotein)